MNFLSHLECPKCKTRHDAHKPQNLCVNCAAPLLVRYRLDEAKHALARDIVRDRPRSMWRYKELLPVQNDRNIVSLGEGFTPMLPAAGTGKAIGLAHLIIKDEGLNPTGTFKARGASAGVSRAKELGIPEVAMPTAGNAGGAWAAYCAAAGIKAHIAMPQDAPEINKLECQIYGADLTLVNGLISDAGKLIAQGVKEHGWFDTATLKEPYRIEGKKTMGYEIAEQLGWRLPDVVIYPAGGGVGIIGIWKAFGELVTLGWVSPKPVRFVVAQAAGCAPLVKAFKEHRADSEFWNGADTLASGLRVPKALGDFLVLQALAESDGTAIEATDPEMLSAMKLVARADGMFICPEGAATIVAAQKLRQSGWLKTGEEVVLINTGAGLKYPEATRDAVKA
ncbi:MAG: threonine synthase [Chloroflexi bacterium]|nr:threonine synthase [Chloroflexota bacterium]